MNLIDVDAPNPLQCPRLGILTDKGIRHGFFTRQGGVSEGLYRGLNCGLGSRDDRDNVLENRRRVAACFGQKLENLASVHQVHSAVAVTIAQNFTHERPEADALVTATPGLALSVLTADCGPILFADGDGKVVGAAHAGWKGALDGVLEATIDAMVALGAKRERIVATLGPSILQDNYEVGPEFLERFLARDPTYEAFFMTSQRPGHALFNLPAFIRKRLHDAGVTPTNLDNCTYDNELRFFSFRRATHRNEPDYGRQISAIMIEEN